MKRTFNYSDDKSNKFWSIEVDGAGFTVDSGEAGTSDQTQTKSFADEKECRAEADKLIFEKIGKEGYAEDERNSQTAGIGRHVFLQDKQTLELVILNYDENGTKLGVTGTGGDRIYEYGSSEELLRAMSDFRSLYGEEHYAWAWQRTETPRDMDHILEVSGIKLYPKPQVLHLLTPYGQPTPFERKSVGQKKIPCKKRVFFKNIIESVAAVYCDESGRRLFKSGYRSPYLRTFDTDEEMNAAFENIKHKYLEDGYELTFDETVDYAFDYWLEECLQTAKNSAENKHETAAD